MNESALVNLEIKLYKAYRSGFFCCGLLMMVMVMTVMLSLAAGLPVNQESVAEGGVPLFILLAISAELCRLFHSGVKSKLDMLRAGNKNRA